MTIASCSSAWPPCTPLHRVHSLSPPLTSHQHGLPTTLKRSTCVRAAAATVIASASRLDHSVHSEGLPVVFTAKPASVPPEPLVLNRPHGVSSSTSSSHGRLQSDGGYAVAAMRSGSLGAQTGATDASRGAGLLERASSLVLDLNREGKHSVSEASSNQILQGLCATGDWPHAQRLYRELSKHQVALEPQSLQQLFTVAIQAAHMHAAAGLLKQIAEQSGTCDQKLCTLVISRLLRAKQRGLENKHVAYSLWRILQATNKTLDAVSYRTGIDACVEMGKLPEAQSLLAAMRTARISPGQGTFHRLMKFHSERGDMDGARRVFKQLREYLQQRRRPAGEPASLPDICAYNTLLAGFVRIDDLIMARAVLDKAKRDGVSPDAQSYATYMHGLCRAGQLREAEAILSEMAETEVMPSVFCYGTLIDNYLRLQQRAAAQRVLGKMSASGLKPSRAIYNMLIRSCCYDQDLPAANQLLLSMQAAGHAPDEVTYGTLLHAAVRSTDAPAALDVLSRMQAQGLSPDMAAYTDLMRLYALIGKPDQAVAAFKQAGEACAGGHDIAAYNCLVSVYVAAGNMQGAESAARQAASVAQQQGMPPPSEAFGVLLKGYQAQLLKGAGNSSMGNGSSSGGSGPRGPGQRSSSDSAIETNAEGVQPLRAQELLRPALASFRYFLASGGKPNKGMSNRVVRLCLTCLDFEAANQVVRALKLVGATASYSQFERWFAEARLKEQKLVQRPIGRPEGRGVERFKWWLGLPNSYYNDG